MNAKLPFRIIRVFDYPRWSRSTLPRIIGVVLYQLPVETFAKQAVLKYFQTVPKFNISTYPKLLFNQKGATKKISLYKPEFISKHRA
jgi:hypothetical protein